MRDSKRPLFPTTRWSLVHVAGNDLNEQQREALNIILTEYWNPLKAHLTGLKKFQSDDADDLLQEFIKAKILEKNILQLARADRGKFRSLLLKSLDNYVINDIRSRSAQKRGPQRAASLDDDNTPFMAVDNATPDRAYDYQWASNVLEASLQRMENHCQQADKDLVWLVLNLRILGPVLRGEDPVEYDILVQNHGFSNRDQASNLLVTAKRMFERYLREVLTEHSMTPEQIDQEITDLIDSFGVE